MDERVSFLGNIFDSGWHLPPAYAFTYHTHPPLVPNALTFLAVVRPWFYSNLESPPRLPSRGSCPISIALRGERERWRGGKGERAFMRRWACCRRPRKVGERERGEEEEREKQAVNRIWTPRVHRGSSRPRPRPRRARATARPCVRARSAAAVCSVSGLAASEERA